jgi:hypothetical protein
MREILCQRVQDGVLVRLVGKWMRAGVMEEGRVYHPEAGVPQGGVISSILSNIYLHEVLDRWFFGEVKPRLKGVAHLVRYADDFVMVFEREDDARRVQAVLPKRFGKYGLRLHPDKTRLVYFKPTTTEPPSEGQAQQGRTFDLLGLTLFWTKSRRGRWTVSQKTMKSRFRRSLKSIYQWCQEHRHDPVREQHRTLSQKLRGHYAYYGVTGNFLALHAFFHQAGAQERPGAQLGTHGGDPEGVPFAGTAHRPLVPAAKISDLKSRMRESRMSGSVGAPGEQSPGATRQCCGGGGQRVAAVRRCGGSSVRSRAHTAGRSRGQCAAVWS